MYDDKRTLEISANDILKLSMPCIYALRCDDSRYVYVSYSSCLMSSVARILERIETPEFTALKYDIDNNKVVIDILCTSSAVLNDKSVTKLHTSNYAEEYKNNGYKFYRPTNLVKYRVNKMATTWKLKSFFVVELINSRHDRILVGVFKSKREMDKFCNRYYPNDTITGFYYANNEWTNEYRSLYTNDDIERNEQSEYRRNVEIGE